MYRTIGTSFFGGTCRFYPSCSDYANQCLNHHNPKTAIILITRRLLKCYPGSKFFGFDPVPEITQQEVQYAKQ